MKHLESIYRNYDIRGEYPKQIHEEGVYKIGVALVKLFKFRTIAVGRDNRPSGNSLFVALAHGITDQGGIVFDLGLVTTPMSYFAQKLDVDVTVMITASHMPSNFNGLKICSVENGALSPEELKNIEVYIQQESLEKSSTFGEIISKDIRNEWNEYFTSKFDFADTGYKLVVDPANMIGVLEIETLKQFEPHLTIHSIYDELDHTCPNHEANPVKFETLNDLGKEVLKKGANIGLAFDGDADRVGFIDEKGEPVPSDVIGTIIIASHLLEKNEGTHVVYTLTATKSLPGFVSEKGGVEIESAVGHTNVKKVMRQHNAMLGIELSGHFFFKETGSTEAGILPALYVLAEMKRRNMSLSELVNEIVVYYHSGEINNDISLPINEIYKKLKEQFNDGDHTELDGLNVDYPDWWFNVRPSANDPVMRLNLEADTKENMDSRLQQVIEIIRSVK